MSTKLAAFVGNPNEYSATEQAATTAEWNSLTAAMGQAPTMMLTYLDETHPLSAWVGDAQWAVASWQASPWLTGVIPNISVPMTLQGNNADADFRAIASGAWDSALTGVLQTWSSAGYSTIYLRPGWEMNGNWMDWSLTSANAADFVAAFQHIAALAHSFTGATVKVVWSPNEGAYSSVPISSYYPGDQAVDIIGIDTYGAPIDSDSTPSATSTGPNDYTLQTALNMAQAHGKPFALAETGGTDATFPANLASVVAASGVPLDYVALWDANASGGNLIWSNNQADSAAWQAAYDKMAQSPGSLVVPPSSSNVISASTLSVVLSGDRAHGAPQFTLKVDGTQIAGPTAVTAAHSNGQTQTFTFTDTLPPGSHTIEIDFVNDPSGSRWGGHRNLYVEQVSVNGTPLLSHEASLYARGYINLVTTTH